MTDSGLAKVLKLLKEEKGITDEEHHIIDRLEKYKRVYRLDNDLLPDHYEMYWKPLEKEEILKELDASIHDSQKGERLDDMLSIIQRGGTYDEIARFMMGKYSDTGKIYEDQTDLIMLHNKHIVELPEKDWHIFLHPNLLNDMVNYSLNTYGIIDRNGKFKITPDLRDYLKMLGLDKNAIRKIIKYKTESAKEIIRKREHEERAAARKERKEKKSAKYANKPKSKQIKPTKQPKQEISYTPPPKLERPIVDLLPKPGELTDDEIHMEFRKLVGRRAHPEFVRKRISRYTGAENAELDKVIDEHSARVVREKLKDSTTMVPGILDLISDDALDREVQEYIRINTHLVNGRVTGLSSTRSALKKVLRITKDEANDLIQEHISDYIKREGLDEVEKEIPPEPIAPITNEKEYETLITNHALMRAKERIGISEKKELERLFNSHGVIIPDVLHDSPSHRKIVKYKGEYYTCIFLPRDDWEKHVVKTIREAKPSEIGHYKRNYRR